MMIPWSGVQPEILQFQQAPRCAQSRGLRPSHTPQVVYHTCRLTTSPKALSADKSCSQKSGHKPHPDASQEGPFLPVPTMPILQGQDRMHCHQWTHGLPTHGRLIGLPSMPALLPRDLPPGTASSELISSYVQLEPIPLAADFRVMSWGVRKCMQTESKESRSSLWWAERVELSKLLFQFPWWIRKTSWADPGVPAASFCGHWRPRSRQCPHPLHPF